jgi:undecaprenyl diphosphate synthase
MDGNGRWAKARGLPRGIGHREGARAFERIVRHAQKTGIGYLTAYAFSTENQGRPADEIAAIKRLFEEYLKRTDDFRREDARLHFLGDLSWVGDPKVLARIAEIEAEYRERESAFTLNIAFNYGGRAELLRAAARIARDYAGGGLALESLDESLFGGYLYTAGQPDVDLVIRTSGELRTSNFLPWQASYAEYVFTDTLWPDFKPADFDQALLEYSARERRMGRSS